MNERVKLTAAPDNKSAEVAADIAALLRARNPLLWVVTREEARVEGYLVEAAGAAGYITRMWDVKQGVTNPAGSAVTGLNGLTDPGDIMDSIRSRADNGAERCVWILRDLPAWLQPPVGMVPIRQLRNLCRYLPGVELSCAQAIIILTPVAEVPPDLADHATVIEWPMPDRPEIASILDAALEGLSEDVRKVAITPSSYEQAIDAAVGLSGEEAAACYAKSLVQLRRIDPVAVSKEKKRVIARERVLEWYDPLRGGLDAVGGLDNLKEWLAKRALAYTADAREYGLPPPKGALLVGVPGCGKSLTAKAVATAWGVPLLKLDLGALKSKFVGESEANMRKAFKVIEAIGRCVVWIDEVEKSLAGATQGAADGGVSADALGSILSWMQERQGEAFVLATANDIEGLPPEFLRKGRFDEIWFIDVPTHSERISVLKAALAEHKRSKVKVDLDEVASASENFTGAELAALVPDAMFVAFANKGREITTRDLVAASETVVPLTQTAGDKIAKLREWAKTRARPASASDARKKPTTSRSRLVDMEE